MVPDPIAPLKEYDCRGRGNNGVVLNFVDKILPFQTKRSHGHTCDRDLF